MKERRKTRRYDIALPMIIQASMGNALAPISGETLDISTRGIYFAASENLTVGMKLGMTIKVPTGLVGGVAVQFFATGQIVRVEKPWKGGVQVVRAAATINRYQCYREGPSGNSGELLSSLTDRISEFESEGGDESIVTNPMKAPASQADSPEAEPHNPHGRSGKE